MLLMVFAAVLSTRTLLSLISYIKYDIIPSEAYE